MTMVDRAPRSKPLAGDPTGDAAPQPPRPRGPGPNRSTRPGRPSSRPDRAEADRLDVVAEASWWLGKTRRLHRRPRAGLRPYEEQGDGVRAGPVRGVALGAPHAQGPPGDRRRLAAAGAPRAGGRHGVDRVRRPRAPRSRGRARHRRSRPARPRWPATRSPWRRRLPSLDLEAQALQTIGRLLIDAGQLAEGLGHLDEAMLSAVEGRLGAVHDRQGALQHDQRLRAARRPPPRRGVDRRDVALVRDATRWRCGRASAGSTTPRCFSSAATGPRPSARRDERAPSSTASTSERRRRLHRDRRDPPPARRPRGRRGSVRDRPKRSAASRAPDSRSSGSRSAASTPRPRSSRAARRADVEPAGPGEAAARRVQIAVAAGDLDAAAEAADELERIAAEYNSPALSAAALSARGTTSARAGRRQRRVRDAATGAPALEQLEVPYEVATARLLLGQACRNCGDEDGAASSFASAADIFDRLGAAIDSQQHPRPHRALGAAGGLTERSRGARPRRLGPTNKEIAAALHLSERTVARHLSNIFTKIGVTVAHRGRGLRLRARPRPARRQQGRQTPPLHLATGMYIGDNFYHADPRGPDSPRSVLRADLIATSIAARPARRRSVVVAMRWALRVARPRVPAAARTGCRRE